MKLTEKQQQVLILLAESPLAKRFYWTGGTLLAYHYLQHRHSVDLDFFTEEPFSFTEVNQFAEEIKATVGFKKIAYKKIFDRWEFFFEDPEPLRIEFVLYNHDKKTLHKRTMLDGVLIDSLEDIAANKTMAYFDRNEPKDLFDLYFLMTKKGFRIDKLLALTYEKFGVTFSESLFWSEAFKRLSLMQTLKPLIEDTDPEALLTEITDYFKNQSARYLKAQLK